MGKNEVLRLDVNYSGRYGGQIDEILLLPLDVNGVLFYTLKEGVTEEEVSLGEIEGKHSSCYGDLTVEVIDLNELNVKQVLNLVQSSNFGQFESFFESLEIGFHEDLENLEDEDEDEYKNDCKEKINSLLIKYGINKDAYGIKTEKIHDKFIEDLKNNYVIKLKDISISADDYERALNLLKSEGIEVF